MKIDTINNKSVKLAMRKATAEEIANGDATDKTLVETRENGSYVAAPPTEGYRMLHGSLDNIPVITPVQKEKLFSILKTLDETDMWSNNSSTVTNVTAVTTVPGIIAEQISVAIAEGKMLHKKPWKDFDLRGDIPSLLIKHGWTVVQEDEERIYFLRPGQTDSQQSGSWHKQDRYLYIFSTSTVFEAQRAYKAAEIFNVLECGNNKDWKECATKLTDLGYGEQKTVPPGVGLFVLQTANQWMKQASGRPIPKPLFEPVWYQGELGILFADTNLGKSILAVQIGDNISKTEKSLYLDFELSDKQFERRYTEDDFQNPYPFPENFIRAEINPEESDFKTAGFKNFESYLYDSIEKSIQQTGARVLIIDNITYLKDTTEQARFALPLMKHLQALKKKYNLSILCLAHTPKRDLSKPITRNDLQGSKMLINFCDSAFAIGESVVDKSIRYIKQIKSRTSEIVYDADNVAVYRINKAGNFLGFEHLNEATEAEHLKQPTENEKTELEQQVRDILDANPQITSYSIAKQLCPDMDKFNSFKVKINRLVNRINGNNGNIL